jgi:mannose-6-phosphate isomerase-like protein (cupin superfamily)
VNRRHNFPMAIVATLPLLAVTAVAAVDSPPIAYFDAKQVTEAFAKGAVLYAKPGVNYMVHASRREAPGQAEVHTLDADVIYVLEGSATFVTGGSIVDPREAAANEIRGSEIQGGEVRTIAKGDVLIVPAGTPHWFKAVSPPLLYYVVKVR